YRDPSSYPQHKIIVIVPEEGLVRLSRKLLNSLKMDKVRLATFDDWIRTQGQHTLRTLPRKLCELTPARVVKLKRHGAVSSVFADLQERRIARFAKRLDRELSIVDGIGDAFQQCSGKNLLAKIDAFYPRAVGMVEAAAK